MTVFSYCQQRYTVLSSGVSEQKDISLPFKKSQQYDSIAIISKANIFVSTLRSKGYAFANVDSMHFSPPLCHIHFYLGKKVHLSIRPYSEEVNSILRASDDALTMKYLPDSTTLSEHCTSILHYLNNHGHPFAQLQLKDILIKEDTTYASLLIDRGAYITYDTLHTIGRYHLNKKYLHHYLELYSGKPYEHDKMLSLSTRMRDLPFLQSDSLPTVTFVNEKAIVNFYLKDKTASRFDFIVGVLPVQTDGSSGFKVIYDVSGEFINKFSQGESIQFKFQKLKGDDLQAFIGGNYPYILGTLFGLDGSFELFQNNGLSADASTLLGIQYLFSGNNILKCSWNNKTSRLSTIDTDAILLSKKLPAQLDYTYNGASLTMIYRKLDYRFNPTRGFDINGRLNGGARSVLSNVQITALSDEAVNFVNAYDTLSKTQFQATMQLEYNMYRPIKKWATIKIGLNSAWRYNDGLILQNEVWRIGGNRLMRGFDELSIATDRFALFTSEFRILLEKNSFLSLPFIDVGRIHRISEGRGEWKTAIGLGMGLNFSTRAGIFNFSFAAGNAFRGSPDFGNTKIHFGYLNLF